MPAAIEHQSGYMRKTQFGQRPYVDITGTTHATPGTQILFAHTLTDPQGKAAKPSFVDITPDGAAAQVYETSANHTSAVVDVRSSTASINFRARLWA